MRDRTSDRGGDAVTAVIPSGGPKGRRRGIAIVPKQRTSFRAKRGIIILSTEGPLYRNDCDSSPSRALRARSARNDRRVVSLGMTVVLVMSFAITACDRGVEIVRDQFARRSRVTIDSLSAQNAALQRQMMVFERISAEKDTLLREVRDAHVLIEAVAEQLRRMDGSGVEVEAVDSASASDVAGVYAAAGEVAVDPAGEIPGGPGTYRDAMLRKLETVRRRLSDVEDSSRVRGERLLEAARDNERLRLEVEEHLRTIEGQKDMISTYLERIAELETQVTALTDSTRKLTEANEILADSLRRITTRANAAWYVVGTREQLVRAGVLTEEGGVLGFGKSLTPSRAMTRNSFTRIDRLRDTVIAMPEAKEYRIISRHDPGLVSVEISPTLGGTMRIKDPERFWSASGWLIVVYD